MIGQPISADKLKEILAEKKYTIVKYVKVNEEFRFGDILNGPEHKDMLNNGEKADSAGFVTIDIESGFCRVKGESMSLNTEHDPADSKKIEALIL